MVSKSIIVKKYRKLGFLFCLLFVSIHGFAQFQVETDETAFQVESYIVPNELNTYMYGDLLKAKKGVLISVGSLRVLFDTILGDFSHVIILDHDKVMCDFNKAHLDLILALSETNKSFKMKAQEAQRYQYLAVLTGHWLTDEMLNKLLSENEIGDQVQVVLKFLKTLPLAKGDEVPIELRKTVVNLWNVLIEPGSLNSSRLFKDFEIVFSELNSRNRGAATFWGNDATWKKIHTMISKKKFTVLNGSLSGEVSIQELSKSLRAQNLLVSVVDISNAWEILLDSPEQSSKLFHNLNVLPYSKDAVLLTTVNSLPFTAGSYSKDRSSITSPAISDDGWIYMYASMSSLLVTGTTTYFKDRQSYLNYVESLL